MLKNPNYWEPGLPYLDQVIVKVFNDQPAMVVALESGAHGHGVPAADPGLDPPEGRSAVEHLQQRRARSVLLHADDTWPRRRWTTSCCGRRSRYAIDRKRFTDAIMGGFAGMPKDLPWPTASSAYEADKNTFYTLDLDKAKTMVAQSGVADPTLRPGVSAGELLRRVRAAGAGDPGEPGADWRERHPQADGDRRLHRAGHRG